MAARFWVGGSGTWDNSSTTNWSATSGGAGGASAPTTADTVTFDANSGTAAVVSVAATAATSTCGINKSDINLNFAGSPTFTGTVTLTAGTITLNSFSLTCSAFSSSNSNARTLAFGTGSITLTGSGTTIWSTDTSTNLTVTGTPVVNATYSGSTGTRSLPFGNTSGPGEANTINVNITAGSDTVAVYGSGIRDLNFTGFTGTWSATGATKTLYGSLTLSSGMTLAASLGTFTFAATSGTKTITSNGKTIDGSVTFNGVGGTFRLQGDLTMGAGRPATLTNGALDLNNFTLSCGTFNSNNSNARTIAFGTGNITITSSGTTVWNTDTSTNLTVTGTPRINATYSGSVGTRSLAIGNSAAPVEANSISVSISAGSDIVAVYGGGIRDLNFTGFTGSWSSTGVNKILYGSLTLSSGMVVAASANPVIFGATSGVQTLSTNNTTIDAPLIFNGVGGTFQFADALTQGSTRAFTVTNGIVRLKAGTTNTVGSFTTGAGTTQRLLQSDTPGSPATISDASGTNTATYLTIQDTAATGGATWTALQSSNNIDAGGNSGWNFGDYASSGLSRGVGLYAGAQGLWGGNSGLWGGFSGLQN